MHNASLPPPSPSTRDLLILAAHPPDLAGLRGTLGESISGALRGLQISGKTTGIGLVYAAIGAAQRIRQYSPRAIVFIGTCGVYPGLPQYRPNDVVISTRVQLLDHAVIAGKSAFQEPMQTALDSHPALVAAMSNAGPRVHRSGVASPLATTIDDALAGNVPHVQNCQVESLEAFSVATACHAEQIPFVAVLGVTHVVGGNARDDWRNFQRSAVTAAAEAVLAWVHTGAPGLPHRSA